MKTFATSKWKAMTLTELLVVLAILGVLVLIAFPVVTPIFQQAYSKEAQINLTHLANLQKSYYYQNISFSTDMEMLGFEQEKLKTEGGKARYQIEIQEASSQDFRATATAISDFDGDGVLNVWEISKDGIPREVVKD